MRKSLSIIAIALITVGSPALAKVPCAPNKFQRPYPWFIPQAMTGDQYADIYLDVDKAGKPVNCRMGANNIYGDDKFWVCKAFLEQLSTAPPSTNPTVGPPPSNLPPNSPIKGTIRRKYLAIGERHALAEKEARKRFFQQHPEERQECYPD